MLSIRIFLLISVMTLSAHTNLFAESRALLVGIGDYDTDRTGWRKIHGDNDVTLLSPLLEKNGFKVRSIINRSATKNNIINSLKGLAAECKPGDFVYFHFSCHGQPVIDCNGDEKRRFDEAIVPYDAPRSEGYSLNGTTYNGENHIIDDELAPYFQKIRMKLGAKGELFIVFDACYSRGLEKGDCDFPEDFDVDSIPEFMRGTADFFNPSDKSYLKSITLPENYISGTLMTVVSACRENERNFERKVGEKYYGSLSYCMYMLLRESADFKVWRDYFKSNHHLKSRCFTAIQHPTITIYE